jgi:putative endonuclease
MTLLSNTHKPAHLAKGSATEEQACQFLMSQGLKLVDRNFRCPIGELDLVMLDGKTLVIVEVRYRKNNRYGGAEASVTRQKQAKIIAATHYYLTQHKTGASIRFDVVAITGDNPLNWIKNAFQTE